VEKNEDECADRALPAEVMGFPTGGRTIIVCFGGKKRKKEQENWRKIDDEHPPQE